MALRIGELLVKRGAATQGDVDRAVREAQARGVPLLSHLLLAGADEGLLAGALAERHHMPGVDLSRSTLALDAMAAVPRSVAETDVILPLSLEGGRLHLAMCQPLDERVVSEVRFVTGLEVSPYAAVKHALSHAIADAYDRLARGEAVWRGKNGPPAAHLALVLPDAGDLDGDVEIVDDADVAVAEEDEGVPIEVVYPEPLPVRADGRLVALVVDDEPEIRQLVQKTLEAKGYAVEAAADGEQALAKADALVPDVILLDAMLPRVHGFEACRRLKASSRTRLIPVVMMTAVYRGWRFAQDARENYGAEDYIEKPFRLDDLFRRVQAARRSSAVRLTEPTPAEPLVQRARELLAKGDLDGAAAVLGEAVRADPYAAEAQFVLGQTLHARGDAFAAMTALERAAELRPNHQAALRALSALYEEKGFRRKAASALERALTTSPEPGRAALRAELLRLLG